MESISKLLNMNKLILKMDLIKKSKIFLKKQSEMEMKD
jgi:hypothetical protein